MKNAIAYGIACLLGLAAFGCGDDGGGSCETMSACGGDIVGAWKIAEFCVDGLNNQAVSGTGGFCSSASTHVGSASASGTMTFTADMRVTESLMVSEHVSIDLPSSCLTQGGVTISCQQLNQATQSIAAQDTDAGTTVPSLSCSSSGGGCSCSASVTEPVTMSGTYTIANGTLRFSFGTETNEYCVQGNKLYLQTSKPMTMTMGSNTATFSLDGRAVLEKQ